MGIWSIPWKNESKAKDFANQIKEGFKIKVDTASNPIDINSDAIGFRFDDTECLIGSDELVDLVYDKANEVKQNFDATDLVTDVAKSMMKEIELQPELPKDLAAINIVRESIGLSPFSPDRPVSKAQQVAQAILNLLKEKNIVIEYSELKDFHTPINPIVRMMNRIPTDLEADVIYGLTIETVEKKEFELDFNSISEVKGFGFDRPGLLRVCFV